jgi:hypothetical protein
MASSANLDIDPDGVRAAGAALSRATDVGGAPPAVTPCAADATSVKIAHALSTSISELINATTVVSHKTARAAGRLGRNAETYESQEQESAASLGSTGRGTAASVPVTDAPSISTPAMVVPPAPAAGVPPSSGKEISALMHGGPGPEALESASRALDVHAEQLDSAAQTVRTARWTSEQNWESSASQQASAHLATLESTYSRHADHARALSRQAGTQADNFRQARSSIPKPEHFTDLEQRLRAASAANAAPGSRGRYTAMITKLQTDLAAAHQQAVNSYLTYTAGGELQADPLQPGAATTTSTPEATSGSRVPDATPGDEEAKLAGAGLGDPNDPLSALGEPGGAPPGGDLMQTVLPAVLGAVTGAAGGLLGALSGAAEKVQQTGTQLVSGLAQGGAAALQGMAGGQPEVPELSGDTGMDDLGLGGGGGGGGGAEPGDTQPASAGEGPLGAAAASASAAPATAPAPTFSSTSAPSAAGVSAGMGAGMGGGMMPPMMGGPGRGGGGGGDDERRLYDEKRLRLETSPNAEPVKGRREARESRSDRKD